jgi:hypothetical protein
MEILIQQNSLCFYGQVKDIVSIFAGYPPEITLREFINLRLS